MIRLSLITLLALSSLTGCAVDYTQKADGSIRFRGIIIIPVEDHKK